MAHLVHVVWMLSYSCVDRQRGIHEPVRLAASGTDRGEGQTDNPGEAHAKHLQLPCQQPHQAHRQAQVISTCTYCGGTLLDHYISYY